MYGGELTWPDKLTATEMVVFIKECLLADILWYYPSYAVHKKRIVFMGNQPEESRSYGWDSLDQIWRRYDG